MFNRKNVVIALVLVITYNVVDFGGEAVDSVDQIKLDRTAQIEQIVDGAQ